MTVLIIRFYQQETYPSASHTRVYAPIWSVLTQGIYQGTNIIIWRNQEAMFLKWKMKIELYKANCRILSSHRHVDPILVPDKWK